MTYAEYLASKERVTKPLGFEATDIGEHLYPFQHDIVQWACRMGRAALFMDCGMGKTICQLEWSRQVIRHVGPESAVLILAPLAVAQQTVREGAKFEIESRYLRADDGAPGIVVANYEMMQHFDIDRFSAVVADESSLLKDYNGKTRNAIISATARTPYRLSCTATPSPNDFMELGNQAEFLGVMSRTEMLSMFFVHDGGSTQDWRIKGHAQKDFWKWVCGWAVMIRKPSDIGYEDGGFVLPGLSVKKCVIPADQAQARASGMLFAEEARTLQERRAAKRGTISERVAAATELVAAEPGKQFILWGNLNDECDELERSIPGSVQVSGSDTQEWKEDAVAWFTGRLCICNRVRSGKRPISPTITSETRPSTNSPASNATPRTRSEKRVTPPTASFASSAECLPEIETRTPSEMESSGQLTELPPRTLTRLSSHKAEAARSAGPRNLRTSQTRSETAESASTSTTIIQPDECGEFSVPRAISESVNSTTIQNESNVQHCICGHISGRRVLVSKVRIFGFGVNLQNCARMAFVGLSDSFEQFYQAVRRCWRYGQTREVHCHVITSELEGAVVANIERKESDMRRMVAGMVEHMRSEMTANIKATRRQTVDYQPAVKMLVPEWIQSEMTP